MYGAYVKLKLIVYNLNIRLVFCRCIFISTMVRASAGCIAFVVMTLIIEQCSSQSSSERYLYSRGEIPTNFILNQSYPDRSEADICRPIRLRIDRVSARFRSELVTADTRLDATFATADARVMTSRMYSRLAALASLHGRLSQTKLNVLKVWTTTADREVADPLSLHYEGRSALVSVGSYGANVLLRLAIQAGFDWVSYVSTTYVKLSVTPDACRTNLDLVFMLDRSTSVGSTNLAHALSFITSVVAFFDISPNATRVGLIPFSTSAQAAISLDDYANQQSLQRALAGVRYTGGYTYTAGALRLARLMLDPTNGYGARPLSWGIPRVAVLITDGRSNLVPVAKDAQALRESGVQVFSVGIGRAELSELVAIASSPSLLHVFLLESFGVVYDLVQLLSFSTCDAPATMDSGTNTTSLVGQDDFRYFQGLCPIFSIAVIIEQTDLTGRCSLYASSSVQNPGPLRGSSVVSNANSTLSRRSVVVTFDNHTSSSRNIYIAVRGLGTRNIFSLVYWDMVFVHEEYTLLAPLGTNQFFLLNLTAQLRPINASFLYFISEGNNGGYFSLTQTTGILSVGSPLPCKATCNTTYVLVIVAQNALYPCHRGRTVVTIVAYSASLIVSPLAPVSLPENTTIGTLVAQVRALGAGDSYLFSISAGNVGGAFAMCPTSGRVTIAARLNYEVTTSYNLTLLVQSVAFPSIRNTTSLLVRVLDVDEPPFFVAPSCAVVSTGCTFQAPENASIGTLLGALRANSSDQHCPGCGNLTFTIDPPQVPFSVNALGELRIAGTLDRERVPSYVFDVIVREQARPLLSSRVGLRVVVMDINDNAPVLVFPTSVIEILQSTPLGTVVARIVGTDADSGINAEIRFAISSTTASPLPFQLNSLTGDLVLVASLRDTTTPFYKFNITLSNPTPGPVTTVTITVRVMGDAQNRPPAFDASVYSATVQEGLAAGTPVLQVRATDPDLESNGWITYSLLTNTTVTTITATPTRSKFPFLVDPVSGLVNTSYDLEVDGNATYIFTVVATDGGAPPLSAIATVAITVLDVARRPPAFLQGAYHFSILETYPPGELVDVVTAVAGNADQGAGAGIVYSIQSPDPAVPFSIGRIDGVVALNRDAFLDANVRSIYSFIVVASDAKVPSLNATVTVTITLIKVNTIPPTFIGPCNAAVLENLSAGTVVTMCTATGFDRTTNMTSNDVGYLIVDGNVGNAFQFVPFDRLGTIVTRKPLNKTVTPSYTLTIEASNSFAYRSLMDITITVLSPSDVNSPPLFVSLPSAINITDSTIANGTTLVTVLAATDRDEGANGRLTYSISGSIQRGNQQTLLTVRVADGGSPSLSATANVTLQFESPCPVQVYSVNEASGVVTAGLLCRVALSPKESNVTIGGNATLHCNVLGNAAPVYQFAHNDSFVTIPSGVGWLRLEGVSFVDGGTYACKVTTQVGSLQSESGVVNIQVPPTILFPPQDQALELGRTAQFTCQASGIPSPVVNWVRIVGGGGTQVGVLPSLRVSILGPFLVITEVQDGDQGTYACIVSNAAGTVTSSATLTIFGVMDAVMASIIDFSMPNSNYTCNDFNASNFENAVSTITGFTTAVSVVAGDALCAPSACNPNPCGNGGSCQLDPLHVGGFYCVCDPGYAGMNCEEDIDECMSGPCLNGGLCSNTWGSFSCDCQANHTGFRCQYSDVCLSQTVSCPPGTTCVETTTRVGGYVCGNITSDPHLAVSTTTLSAAQLEEIEYVLLEAQTLSTAIRRKRSDPNNMQFDYSSCEARFIPMGDYYILIWVCLPGAPPPGIESLHILCNYFSRITGISRCWLPGNVTFFELVPAPPPTNLSVSFILLDPTTGGPLSSTMALKVLALKGALEKMGSYGYHVTGFSEATAASAFNSTSVGSLAAIITTVLLVVLVAICITIVALIIGRKRDTKRRIKLSQTACSISSLSTFSSQQHDPDSLQDSPYSLIPAEKETTYTLQPHQSFVEDPFDDPVYVSRYTVHHPHPASSSPHLGTQSIMSNRAKSTFDVAEPSSSLQGKGHPDKRAPLPTPRPDGPRRF